MQWREARAAARIAAAVPCYSPVAHWPELGAWRLVSDLAEFQDRLLLHASLEAVRLSRAG